jgi:lipoate-protein ligase A
VKVWRVIFDEGSPRPGAMNMALDEALMEAQRDVAHPPTLRFYAWQPACVSLGYFQRAEAEVDLGACHAAGVHVVRRATGGRAVLHDDEVTYSVAIRQELLPGSVVETYGALSQGILRGLRYLGIEGQLARVGARRRPGAGEDGLAAACFDAPSWYETLVDGRKIIGSAQTRASGVILQHGSLLIGFDAARLTGLLRLRSAESRGRLAAALGASVTSISEHLGRRPAPGEVARALACGMASALGLSLYAGSYTARELELARRLHIDKYLTQEWTLRR